MKEMSLSFSVNQMYVGTFIVQNFDQDCFRLIGHFTVVCLHTKPLSETAAQVDLAIFDTNPFAFDMQILYLLCQLVFGLYLVKVSPNLSFIQRPGYMSQNCKIVYCQI